MFTCLVLTLLICQCSFSIAPKKQAVIPITGQRRSLVTSLNTFKCLLTDVLGNYEAFLNVAEYPLKTIMKGTFSKEFFLKHYNTTEKEKVLATCILCRIALQFFLSYTRQGVTVTSLKKFAYLLCNLVGHLVENSVCRSLVDINADVIHYIALNSKKLTAKEACAIILQPYGCYKNHRPKWSIYIPSGQSVELNVQNIGSEHFKVLHITDPHIDSLYTPRASAKCGKPLCCQVDQDVNVNGAGHWADYRDCDMPWYTMENLLDDIVKKHMKDPSSFSYLYFTGDIISHRIWDTSKKSNTKEIKRMFRMLKEKLGSIRVFPILGNHESHPTNLFAPLSVPKTLSTQWLYDLVAKEWSSWLPASALATVRTGGYYTVLVKPGFRIIALNFNACYVLNWWLLYINSDLYNQLQWLVQELLKAEQAKEAVHILSHGPPGESECLTAWSRDFQRIVERFSHTITAQFNGHTHFDEFKIFYNSSNIFQPIGVAYNGGSFTSFTNVNPNYRIYSVNAQNLKVTNYRQWVFQVPVANFFPTQNPEWYELYSFKDAYGLKTLELQSLNSLVERMTKNKRLLQEYYRFKVRDSETAMMDICGKQCMLDNLCSIVTTVFDDNAKCQQLKAKFVID